MPRNEYRKALAMTALVKIAEGRQFSQGRHPVRLSDISCRGCRIAAAGLHLEAGRRIILKPEGLESISGTVRWASQQFAGVEFDRALHPAVVENLCSLHPDDDGTAVTDISKH